MTEHCQQTTHYPSLVGKTVFITGGGTGIGAEMVRRFAMQGALVTFVDMAKTPSVELVGELSRYDIRFEQCDLRDIAHLQQIIEKTGRERGPIGVLINNAADDTRHNIDEVTVEYWDDRLAVNLRPSFFAAQAVSQQMKEINGGSIINMGSASWRIKQSCMPAYTSAKAAIEGMSRSLASAYGQHNIRVNTLVPGWVMTQRQMSHWLDPDVVETVKQQQCIHQTLEPSHIVNAALFLAADDSSMMTAQTLTIDAGWT
ncbi:SDR family oxidoreductase [Salinimonas sp. HHU 13199]|uniref:SDR family oxidoreductase n=1 Tax=Salinimonas profundi TaxID=2729140 RepID=A0ABR8LL27_9ALTE|nr:SDR family oxidoreductase [Salinimonas profundi]MBD3586906.1 SDR family oxidoreductase [Salinimonas profundi]